MEAKLGETSYFGSCPISKGRISHMSPMPGRSQKIKENINPIPDIYQRKVKGGGGPNSLQRLRPRAARSRLKRAHSHSSETQNPGYTTDLHGRFQKLIHNLMTDALRCPRKSETDGCKLQLTVFLPLVSLMHAE